MQRLADAVVIDNLPRSAIGKVLKIKLRDIYLEKNQPSNIHRVV